MAAGSPALREPRALPAWRVPKHVLTADYFLGDAGTHVISAQRYARHLSWAEVSPYDTTTWRTGIRMMFYTDPNRQIAHEPLWNSVEQTFAHDCDGSRISRMYPANGPNGRPQFLMDPHSAALRQIWRAYVSRFFSAGHFSAVFDDDADNIQYMDSTPCRFDAGEWLQASIDEVRSLGFPVVYNALEPPLSTNAMNPAIALNAVSVGGMMEYCYSDTPRPPTDGRWLAEEETELAMDASRKLFFCYGNATADASASTGFRLYEFGSFLLTYDPERSIFWEHWSTPSVAHVMPESEFVPLQPVRSVATVQQLQIEGGAYSRAYYRCYLRGRFVGACAVYVNPTMGTLSLPRSWYRRTLDITGSGIFDGGAIAIDGPAPGGTIAPMSAIIAVK